MARRLAGTRTLPYRASMGSRVTKLGLVFLLGILLGEGILQLLALVMDDRASAWRAGAKSRVLCVGDSHTYGAGVPRDQTYPVHLQRALDDLAPGIHSVMNLGLPGMSSTQLRHRLPLWIQRYRPSVVVIWVGVNDVWNRMEVDDGAPALPLRLDGLLSRSRIYRLLRVWLHDRELERYVPESDEDLVWHVAELEGVLSDETYTVRHAGVVERIAHGEHTAPPELPEDAALAEAVASRLREDLEAMADYSAAAGIPAILLTYPIEASWFYVVNRVAREVAEERGLPLVETLVPTTRVPADERDWRWAAHPGPRIYREIAAELAPLLAAVPEGGDLRERFPPAQPTFRQTRPHHFVPILDGEERQ